MWIWTCLDLFHYVWKLMIFLKDVNFLLWRCSPTNIERNIRELKELNTVKVSAPYQPWHSETCRINEICFKRIWIHHLSYQSVAQPNKFNYLGCKACWIWSVIASTLAVTWIQQVKCIAAVAHTTKTVKCAPGVLNPARHCHSWCIDLLDVVSLVT